MPQGRVKWYSAQKGYGFIQPDDGGGDDVFVHVSALPVGVDSLIEGQKVSFELGKGKNGKTAATDLVLE